MNETNKFRVWDWDTEDWLPHDRYEEVLQFNWHVSGPDEGIAWGEIKHGENLEMIFPDRKGDYLDPRE
jgi:hypothetical protein